MGWIQVVQRQGKCQGDVWGRRGEGLGFHGDVRCGPQEGFWGSLSQALTWKGMGSLILGVKPASKRGGGRLGGYAGSKRDLWGMKGWGGAACGVVWMENLELVPHQGSHLSTSRHPG